MSRPVWARKLRPMALMTPAGDGGLEAVGVADGDDELADLEGGGIAKGDGGDAGAIRADDGEIGVGVFADQRGFHGAAVGEGNGEFAVAGVVDDVAVGEDEAIVGEKKAGAAAAVLAGDVDFHDGGGDGFDDAGDGLGVGVEKSGFGEGLAFGEGLVRFRIGV